MPTSSFVESAFWCFDALFVPQQHPARDLQDTFYISGNSVLGIVHISIAHEHTDPVKSLPPEPSYYKRVSTVHEHGGYGSTGYRAPWSHEESSKLLLRTHTTASSTFMLYKLAARCRGEEVEGDENEFTHGAKATTNLGETSADDGFRPAKLFSIDRVFRNETMDATHLAEFHQVEGVVADRGLTLADLIGEVNPSMYLIVIDCTSCRFHESLFQKNGYRKSALQTSIQSLYRGQKFPGQSKVHSNNFLPWNSLRSKSSHSIPCSTNGSRSATVVCFALKCWNRWASRRMCEYMGGG